MSSFYDMYVPFQPLLTDRWNTCVFICIFVQRGGRRRRAGVQTSCLKAMYHQPIAEMLTCRHQNKHRIQGEARLMNTKVELYLAVSFLRLTISLSPLTPVGLSVLCALPPQVPKLFLFSFFSSFFLCFFYSSSFLCLCSCLHYVFSRWKRTTLTTTPQRPPCSTSPPSSPLTSSLPLPCFACRSCPHAFMRHTILPPDLKENTIEIVRYLSMVICHAQLLPLLLPWN